MASCVSAINSLKQKIIKFSASVILEILNQNCRKCYAAKPTSPEKSHIFVKWGNSSTNDIYTKLISIYTKKAFVSLEFHFCLTKFFIEIYSSRFLLIRLSLKWGFDGCGHGFGDATDSADLADLTDSTDSDINPHLDRLVYF